MIGDGALVDAGDVIGHTTGIGEHQPLKFTCEEMGKVVLAIAHYESGYSKEEWEANCRQAFNMLFKKHR